MPAYTQELRRIAVETPLGKDVLVLASFSGREEMSRLFSYELEMLSEKDSLAAQDIVGKNVTFWVEFADGSPRCFNGFVSRFSYCGRGDRLSLYRAEVVPWLWFLTRTADCRIFQNKSVPDILRQVFGDLGLSDFTTSEIKGSHPAWEYCVQYRETDFNFVSRLMEQEGIFYFFRHEKGKHTLVLADQKGAYKDCVEKEVEFRGSLSAPELFDHISRWEHRYEFRTGKWAQTDYNFETPSTSLMAQTSTLVKLDGNVRYEFYEFPGQYEKKAEGDAEVKIRMEEEEAGYDVVHGESCCRSFSPGGKFKLAKHHSQAEEGKGYVVLSVVHKAEMGGAYISGVDTSGQGYVNSFTCIPDSVTFRSARVTPKPYIHGAQTAVVVGPSGEEIWPDKYGRVKVQFHWDREGKKNENSSCWIRVAQPWAGKQWGAIHIPRIGQEAVVSYLEGDPDRPMITNMVYNAEMMPPYTLPDNKTQTGIKTRSSKGGSEENFNEIRFEDKKGEEQLYVHAEKNQDIEVENDETHWVGHDRKKTIDRDETTSIGRDRSESVGQNEKITIGKNRSEEVAGNEFVAVQGNRTRQVSKDETITIDGKRTQTVGKDEQLSVGGNRDQTVAGKDQLTVGKELFVTVADQITFQTGAASITMKKSGDIQIKGADIMITGSGKIQVKASSDVTIKGSQVKAN